MQGIQFYQAVAALDSQNGCVALTAVEGDYVGKKALFLKKGDTWRLIWPSEPDPWTEVCRIRLGEMSGAQQTGIYATDKGRVFCELFSGEKKLVVCGGGHVSIPMIQIARMTGFAVTVLEDRPEFADHAKKAGASAVLCAPFAQGLAQVAGDADTFFVIVTRGHFYDQICLEAILKKESAYIGMMGSRKRTGILKQNLAERGYAKTVIDGIHTPIGLSIGARTPEEIAVSVLAEVIAVKNKLPAGGFERKILDAVLHGTGGQPAGVLSTIIRREGSAPRDVGTKMLVRADGSCIGTVGGGSAEAQIREQALRLFRSGRGQIEIIHADLSGKEAAKEGMVCGGTLDVMLEVISEKRDGGSKC